MNTLLCAGALLASITLGWLIETLACRIGHHRTCTTEPEPQLPPLTELAGLEWLECSSTTCAHLETTHRRVHGTELWACTGCDTTRTNTKGADHG